MYVYFYSLHVSDSRVPIIRRIIVSIRHLIYVTLFRWPSGMQVRPDGHLHSVIQTTCRTDTIILLMMGTWLSETCKVKWSRYRPGVAQRVGRGIALLLHDCDTRRGWEVRSTTRPHPVPILQECGWPPGPVWTGGKSRPHRDSIPDRPASSQSLYWLSYRDYVRNM